VLVPRRHPDFVARLACAGARGVVHAHIHGHSGRAWLLAATCGVASRRAILTVHSGLAPIFILRHLALVRAACAPYCAIVCVSEPLRQAIGAAGVPPQRLFMAPAFLEDAISESLSPAGMAALRRRHPILIAAAMAPGHEYGLDVLLPAWALVRAAEPQAGLILYGPSVRRPGLAGPSLYLFDSLPRAEALGLVRACDLFVRPTRADGDATSVREALAFGCRVVASDAAVRPIGAVLFRNGNAQDLACAIARALAAPAPRVTVDQAKPLLLDLYARLGLQPEAPLEEAPCVASPAA
jgi:glycosyltransferase involved in cell wall biosynthesis